MLTIKRCGILLAVACFVYLVLNIVVWHMNLVVAISGAICATAASGLFLYFIKIVSRKKEQEAIWTAEHFERELLTAKERGKTDMKLLNRLTRDNARLQERIGNLESQNKMLRARIWNLESHDKLLKARNLQYESQMDVFNDKNEFIELSGDNDDF